MIRTILIAPVPSASAPERGSFLAPGQRYRTHDGGEQYTVSRLVRDEFGLLHVTLRTGAGRDLSAFAEQIEAAVSTGDLHPVAVDGTLAHC